MKFAFIDWWPRYCGVTEVMRHWYTGAAALEYAADLVTFSKSGKLLKPWGSMADNTKVYKIRDAVDVLNSYDLIVLSDIICQTPIIANQEPEPYFLDVMRKITTPWTTMLHDGSYPPKHARVISEMLATPSFTKTVITTRPMMVKRRFAEFGIDQLKLVYYPYLPYNFAGTVPFTGKRKRDFIMTSRVTTTKGQSAALDLLRDLKADVHVWGITAYGKPSPAWSELWELGVALGYDQLAFPKIAKRTHNKHPLAYKFYTGEFALGYGKRKFVYHDAFDRLDDVDWAPWFSLSLTNSSLHESLEVVSLEGVAKGCVAVVPETQFIPQKKSMAYDGLITVPYRHATWSVKDDNQVKACKQDWDRPTIVGILNELAKASEAEIRELQERQRADFAVKHQPKKVLAALLKEL